MENRSQATAMYLTVAAAVAVGTFVLGACNVIGVTGSGAVKAESRPVAAFDKIEIDHGIAANVEIGPAADLEVETDENLLQYVSTTVNGNTLKITTTRDLAASQPPAVTIVIPALTGVTASGGSQVTVAGLAADTFGAEISGGARLNATGTANMVGLDISGGSRAELEGLEATTVAVDVSGGATANVRATDSVIGEVSGGGHAVVYGNPTISIPPDISGSVERGG